MYCLCRCVLCIVCNCVQYYCHRVANQLQLMYHIRHLNDQGSCSPRHARWYHSSVGIILGLSLGYILGITLVNEITLRTALFSAIKQHVAVIPCRRFGTT